MRRYSIMTVIKKEMETNSPDTAIKVHLNPRDTADDVYRKLQEAVSKEKTAEVLSTVRELSARSSITVLSGGNF